MHLPPGSAQGLVKESRRGFLRLFQGQNGLSSRACRHPVSEGCGPVTRGYWAPVLSPLFSDSLAILLGEAIQCIVLSPNPRHDAVFPPRYPAAGVCYSPLLFANGFLKLPLSIYITVRRAKLCVCVCVCVCVCTHLVAYLVVSNSLRPQGLQPARLL